VERILAWNGGIGKKPCLFWKTVNRAENSRWGRKDLKEAVFLRGILRKNSPSRKKRQRNSYGVYLSQRRDKVRRAADELNRSSPFLFLKGEEEPDNCFPRKHGGP